MVDQIHHLSFKHITQHLQHLQYFVNQKNFVEISAFQLNPSNYVNCLNPLNLLSVSNSLKLFCLALTAHKTEILLAEISSISNELLYNCMNIRTLSISRLISALIDANPIIFLYSDCKQFHWRVFIEFGEIVGWYLFNLVDCATIERQMDVSAGGIYARMAVKRDSCWLMFIQWFNYFFWMMEDSVYF